MANIAIFASGSGTNAENIVKYFSNHHTVNISLILTNNSSARVIERAEKLDVTCFLFNKTDLAINGKVVHLLRKYSIDIIVLAGFLLMIPLNIIQSFPNRIINIHPALLPKFGGKGMYGQKVHQAVIEHKEKISGISIHYVNEKYDDGKIIFQKKCLVMPDDTPESLAQRIHQLEYQFFPLIIEKLTQNLE